jgi:hypothetical protein
MKSIVQNLDDNSCFLCGSQRDLELHHIMHGMANRRLSTRLGLVCWLCKTHHTGRFGVHQDAELNERLQKEAQRAFEETHPHSEWMRIFKKNYL